MLVLGIESTAHTLGVNIVLQRRDWRMIEAMSLIPQ